MSDHTGYRTETPMTKVLDRLFLGCFRNAERLIEDNPRGITHVVNCTTELLTLPRRQFHIIQMDQLDGADWNVQKVYAAIRWMHQAIEGGKKVLVHCHAGISRSPVMTAAYLYTCGFDFDRALDQIKLLRPQVLPHPAITASMRRAFGLTAVSLEHRA